MLRSAVLTSECHYMVCQDLTVFTAIKGRKQQLFNSNGKCYLCYDLTHLYGCPHLGTLLHYFTYNFIFNKFDAVVNLFSPHIQSCHS